MSAAVVLVALVDPQPGPLVLAAVLAMTLSRNRLVTSWRGRAEAIVLLPVLGLGTAGVAWLLVNVPIAGAVAYVAAMFLSIWLRRFGATWTRIGTLIALPFVTLLITPAAGAGTTPLEVALLSLVVLAIVVVLRIVAEVTRFVPRAPRPQPRPESQPQSQSGPEPQSRSPQGQPEPGSLPLAAVVPPAAQRAGMRPIASTRMAIQMAIALAAGFVLGALLFPEHVTWVVFTAFIVCSGNRGRADVLHKSGLRIVGAAFGTALASVAVLWLGPAHTALQGPPLVVLLLVIIAIGLWLREWTYAAWAVAMTLVITLLQGAALPIPAGSDATQLWIRILAIVVGAVCGVAASWFVLPVRSEGVVRRRLAAALAAMSELAAEPSAANDRELRAALEKLDEVAPPWVALERVTGWRKSARKPGEWINLAHECAGLVRAQPRLSGSARRALGEARRSMREPVAIGPALLALRDALQTR